MNQQAITDNKTHALHIQKWWRIVHPMTCGNNSSHILEPTENGWKCPVDGCGYTQTYDPPKPTWFLRST